MTSHARHIAYSCCKHDIHLSSFKAAKFYYLPLDVKTKMQNVATFWRECILYSIGFVPVYNVADNANVSVCVWKVNKITCRYKILCRRQGLRCPYNLSNLYGQRRPYRLHNILYRPVILFKPFTLIHSHWHYLLSGKLVRLRDEASQVIQALVLLSCIV